MAAIKVLSGGAPQGAFLKLAPAFERETGHRLDFTFAVLSVLQKRIAAGEAADVLIQPTYVLDDYVTSGVALVANRAVLGLVSINAVVRTDCRPRAGGDPYAVLFDIQRKPASCLHS